MSTEETEKAPKRQEAAQSKPAGQRSTDSRLLEDIEYATSLPIPSRNDYWSIESGAVMPGGKNRLLNFFKKKVITEEELSNLRQEAESAPGRARVKIQMINKKNAASPSLSILSAYCTYRMVLNSSNRKTVMDGLKTASKEAAAALINDGLSLYNIESFFSIYFEYLSKLKRFQVNTYKTLRESASYQGSKKKLAGAIKICDGLLDEKSRIQKVLNQIKGKFKSSSYTLLWVFDQIQAAGRKVEQNDFRALCGTVEARELLVYTLALTETFARIPILSPLVDTLLQILPESTQSLYLRKSTIKMTRAFIQLNFAIQEGNMDKMRTLGRQIFKSGSENIQRIADQPIKQSYEADPYFHLSRVAILTFGAFDAKEQREILSQSLSAMKRVVKADMTKNHAYTTTAQAMVQKISTLLSDQPA